MTILRQYSLPNCKLILQGVGDPAVPIDPIRPLLSILVNAECHFSGYEQPIQGGRDFFESLAACVSQYAQEFLSGLQHPIAQGIVQLQNLDANRHRLTVLPLAEGGQPQSIDLGTVQLFDLVEAIDQFVADPQTLPDFKLGLMPLSKRYVTASEPIAQRAAPAAIGLSSLAAAAALLFFVPIPEVRRPEPANANASPDEVSEVSPTPATAADSPPDSTNSIDTPTDSATSSPSPTDSPTDSPIASPSPGATPSEAEVTALLNNTPEITSPETIRQLKLSLRDQLDRAWTQKPPAFDEPLEYRVAVSGEGDILGFKFVNDASIAHVRETPLLDNSYQPIDPNAPNREPIAQMRVVFTPNGVIQVSPWHGEPD